MKTAMIYHSRDIDGWLSAAIVKKWFATQPQPDSPDFASTIDFLGYDYGQPIPDLSGYDKVIMCDVSFPPQKMFELYVDLSSRLVWIDHHISAIDAVLDRIGLPALEGTQSSDKAACELTWEYFFTGKKMPELVRLCGMYDSFRHKGLDEEQKVLEFQYGARTVITCPETAYYRLMLSVDFAEMGLGDNPDTKVLESGKSIYKYLCSEAKGIYKKAFPVEFHNLQYEGSDDVNPFKLLAVNQDRFNPVNFGIDYHKEGYDGFACFWYKAGKWSFSLYNDNGLVDCSKIAKQYGGGGHRGASGMVIKDIEGFLAKHKS